MRKDHGEEPLEGGTGEPSSAATPQQPGDDDLLDTSPYDAPGEEPTVVAGSPGEAQQDGEPGYGAAPAPGSGPLVAESGEVPGDEPVRRRRWLIPVIVVVVVLAAAAVVAVLMLRGPDDEKPEPPVATSAPASEEPSDEASDEPTAEASEEPSDEPSDEPSEDATDEEGELGDQLEESIEAADTTFEVTDDGFATDSDIVDDGALEAYTATYESGDEEISFLATQWSDTDLADEYAEELGDDLDGAEQVTTGHTYTNDTGTYWAFLLDDGQGCYIWTTDRGHVLKITGSTDFVDAFYSAYPL